VLHGFIGWSIFGLKSDARNEFYLCAKGKGGLEEMKERIDQKQIQFVFLRLIHSATKVDDYFLICWVPNRDEMLLNRTSEWLPTVKAFFKPRRQVLASSFDELTEEALFDEYQSHSKFKLEQTNK
jgi:hypothetical protein